MKDSTGITDRSLLAGSAYKTAHDLAARQSLYQWQYPRYDLPAMVTDLLRDVRGTVVDVGCGNGRFLARLAQERPDLDLLGLDVSPGILKGLPQPVAVADAVRLPLRTESADAALALHMLYHVADIPSAVAELRRVLTGGGLLIASTNGARDKAELDRLWRRAAGDVLGVDEGPERLSLSARFSLEKAPDLLRTAFSDVTVVELPGTIRVTTPDPVIAHMNSYRAWAGQQGVPFETTVERARHIVADRIDRDGAFEITCLGGLLVCTG
ncbi:class I SAM-dependent methyltransferase [Streptomyces sp. NPDC047315]|uniref:class I SAM-dependent methyltransferase n=1 Tax=Streptomyces sp. NPDC047315 TaxID=3155142 RepID=UPI0033EECFE9